MYAVYGSEDAAEPALGSDRRHRDAPRFRGKNERGEVVGEQRWPEGDTLSHAAACACCPSHARTSAPTPRPPARVAVASGIVQVPG
jgi:hypothetical protein